MGAPQGATASLPAQLLLAACAAACLALAVALPNAPWLPVDWNGARAVLALTSGGLFAKLGATLRSSGVTRQSPTGSPAAVVLGQEIIQRWSAPRWAAVCLSVALLGFAKYHSDAALVLIPALLLVGALFSMLITKKDT